MKVIDNFIEQSSFNQLQQYCFNKISWKYQENVVGFKPDEPFAQESKDCFQFVHTFYTSKGPTIDITASQHCDALNPVLKQLNPYYILRIKANIRTRTAQLLHSQYHVDCGANTGQLTAIYYLNTNDGYTLFEGGSKVESISNRMIIFDGSERHCGTSCTDQKVRMVLNLNYLPVKF